MRFWKRQREAKLYKEWVKHSGLPSEAIPKREAVEELSIREGKRDRLRPYKERLLAVVRKLLRL